MAALLLGRNATVTICHSRTRDLPSVAREADILIAAIGRPIFVSAEFVKPGAIVIDVGMNRVGPEFAAQPGPRSRQDPPPGKERQRPRRGRRLCPSARGGVVDHARAGRRRPDDDRHADEEQRRRRGAEAGVILRVGLTGGIASGKSTILRILAGLGCITVDADAIVSRLYRQGEAGYEAIVRSYGKEILLPDGEIDRKKLAALAFATPEEAQRLNALIHPLVLAEEARLMSETGPRAVDERAIHVGAIYVVEATLLLEAGGRERYDRIVVVDVPPEVQIARAVARGMSREEVERRMARQMPRQERLRHADYVIDNGGEEHEALAQTERVYERLVADLEARAKAKA